jgi:hypothetical protein
MKYNRVISTAVLVLLLGTTLPAFAQKGEGEKGGGGGKQQATQHEQQPQHAQQAQHQQQAQQRQQPERQQQTQRAQETQRQAQPQRAQRYEGQRQQSVASNRGNNGNHGNGNNGNHYGRIPDDHYRANFGHGHSFHMGRPRMISGYNRFQYGGYWFGYNQGWPVGWDYNDDCYVEYIDGYYYMFNVRHPGFRLTLSIF